MNYKGKSNEKDDKSQAEKEDAKQKALLFSNEQKDVLKLAEELSKNGNF